MNPLQRNESRDVSGSFCADIVADITTSQLNTGRHIIWQHEQQVAQYNTKIYKNNVINLF